MSTHVLHLFERCGVLSGEAVGEIASWGHNSGFSADASVRIRAKDRAGLERLLRYCAPPAFSLERLSRRLEGERVVYRLPKPRPDGTQHLRLGVDDLLDGLASQSFSFEVTKSRRSLRAHRLLKVRHQLRTQSGDVGPPSNV